MTFRGLKHLSSFIKIKKKTTNPTTADLNSQSQDFPASEVSLYRQPLESTKVQIRNSLTRSDTIASHTH